MKLTQISQNKICNGAGGQKTHQMYNTKTNRIVVRVYKLLLKQKNDS